MKYILVLSCMFLLLYSCQEPDKPVTSKEAETMAHIIDSSINAKKPTIFNALISENVFADRIATHGKFKKTAGFMSDVKVALKSANLGDQFIRQIVDNGTYKLVKQYEKNGEQHLLFRLYSSAGLNYYDYELVRYKGKVCIADIFIYQAGAKLSAVLSDLVRMSGAYSDGAATGSNEDFGSIKEIQKVKRLMEEGRYQEAETAFDKLPPKIREEKVVRFFGIQLSSHLSNDKYLLQLDEYKAKYATDPTIYLLLIDAYVLRKEYEEAMVCIDKLDAIIASDPFLDYYRALVFKLMGNLPDARKSLETLHENMPAFGDGELELIANYLDAEEYEKARELIKRYEANKNFNQETLSAILAGYPAFDH